MPDDRVRQLSGALRGRQLFFPQWRVRKALRELTRLGSLPAISELSFAAQYHPHGTVRTLALESLTSLALEARRTGSGVQPGSAEEAICRLALLGDKAAWTTALDRHFLPAPGPSRLHFLFLSEQFEKLELASCSPSEISYGLFLGDGRKEITELARRHRRVDWAEASACCDLARLSETQWDVILDLLFGARRLDALNGLALRVTPRRAASILLRLARDGFVPDGDAGLFLRLARLAAEVPKTPDLLTRPLTAAAYATSPASGRIESILIAHGTSRVLAASTGEDWNGERRTEITSLDLAVLDRPERIASITRRDQGIIRGKGGISCVVPWARGAVSLPVMLAPDGGSLFHPDGARIVQRSISGGEELWSSERHSLLVTALIASNDGRFLASGTVHGEIELWSLPGLQPIASASNRALAPAGKGPRRLLERLKGFLRRKDEFESTAGCVCSLAFTTDGTHIVTGSLDGSVRIWGLPDLALRHVEKAHSGPVTRLVPLMGGQFVASASPGKDATVVLWKLPEGERWRTIDYLHGPLGALVAGVEDGTLVSVGLNGSISLWTMADDGEQRRRISDPQDFSPTAPQFDCVAASPDGRFLAAGSPQGLWIWSLARNERLGPVPGVGKVSVLAWTAEGMLLIAAEEEHSESSYDVRSKSDESSLRMIRIGLFDEPVWPVIRSLPGRPTVDAERGYRGTAQIERLGERIPLVIDTLEKRDLSEDDRARLGFIQELHRAQLPWIIEAVRSGDLHAIVWALTALSHYASETDVRALLPELRAMIADADHGASIAQAIIRSALPLVEGDVVILPLLLPQIEWAYPEGNELYESERRYAERQRQIEQARGRVVSALCRAGAGIAPGFIRVLDSVTNETLAATSGVLEVLHENDAAGLVPIILGRLIAWREQFDFGEDFDPVGGGLWDCLASLGTSALPHLVDGLRPDEPYRCKICLDLLGSLREDATSAVPAIEEFQKTLLGRTWTEHDLSLLHEVDRALEAITGESQDDYSEYEDDYE